jgi:hypothetical protein
MYVFIEEFFKKHEELIFLKFDFGLIIELIDKIIIPGSRESEFDIKSSALLTMDTINAFVFENLCRPSKKRPDLA